MVQFGVQAKWSVNRTELNFSITNPTRGHSLGLELGGAITVSGSDVSQECLDETHCCHLQQYGEDDWSLTSESISREYRNGCAYSFRKVTTVELLIMHLVMMHICHNAYLFGYT